MVDAARAFGDYDGTLRTILLAFKYDRRRGLAKRLGAMMRSCGAELLHDADCVVPVPLHPWRRLRRGFNQATDLSQHLHLPIVHALWRTRATAAQTGLNAVQRRRNVNHAFALSPLLSHPSRNGLRSARIVLVDDVRTTGATLSACAMVLKDAGAREVRALTVARATLPPRKS